MMVTGNQQKYYIRSGTSRLDQKTQTDIVGSIHPDERSLPQLIAMSAEYSKLLLYYDPENKPDGAWYDFFADDHMFALSRILTFDANQRADQFLHLLKQLDYKLFIEEDASDEWSNAIEYTFEVFRLMDEWITIFRRDSLGIEGFAKEVKIARSSIQNEIDRFYFLAFHSESLFERRIRLPFDELQSIEKEGVPGRESKFSGLKDSEIRKKFRKGLNRIYYRLHNTTIHLQQTAEIYFERSTRSARHQPQTGLLIAFLKLYRQQALDFNEFAERHREFYYRSVLQESETKAEPDRAIVLLKASDQVSEAILKRGTRFMAGKDDENRDVLFELESNAVVNHAEITALQTMCLGQNPKYGLDSGDQGKFVTGLFTADNISKNFSGEVWPLLGEDKTGQFQSGSLKEGATGFTIGSTALFLSEARRRVTLRLLFETESFARFKLNLESLIGILENETSANFLYKLTSDGFLLDYTSPAGWYSKLQFSADFVDIGSSDEKPVLKISFVLDPQEPSVSGYNQQTHGPGLKGNYPFVRLRLNPDAHIYPYSILSPLQIERIKCDIRVEEILNPVVYNNIGQVNPDEAFFPFGPVPEKGSWMVVGHPEAMNKQVDELAFRIQWENLPDLPYGMQDYYRNYPGEVDNQSYKVGVQVLDKGNWKPVLKEHTWLFRSKDQHDAGPPHPEDRLSDTTLLKVENLKDRIPPTRPEAFDQEPVYTTRSQNGFIRIELAEPDQAFGHRQYPVLMSSVYLQNANVKKAKKLLPLPNEPFAPLINRLTLGYRQQLNKSITVNAQDGGFDLYYVHPLELEQWANSDPGQYSVPLLRRFENAGELRLTLSNVNPPQLVSLFFHLKDRLSENRYRKGPEIIWQYWYEEKWESFEDNMIVNDTTNGFLSSGIVELDLPSKLGNKPNRESSQVFIRTGVKDEYELVNYAFGVATQAIEAVRVVDTGQKNVSVVKAGSITGISGGAEGIDSVSQPLASFGGRSEENREEFHARIPQLLRHRSRAVHAHDVEKLVLSEFPVIRKVICLPGISSDKPQSDPGNMVITVVPDSTLYKETSKYRPQLSSGKLHDITLFLADKVSPFAKIEVRNPRYERVTLRCRVRFKSGVSAGMRIKELNKELISYLSPWIEDMTSDIEFADSFELTDITGFIYSRPYVEFVTGLSAIKIAEEHSNRFELSDTSRADKDHPALQPTRPWSVMVSDYTHEISILEKSRTHPSTPAGIGNLQLGDDFIIS